MLIKKELDMATIGKTGPLSTQEYYRLREMLLSQYPRAREELLVRCGLTGDGEVSPDALWRLMGDKPLYTNKSVVSGRPYEYAWAHGMYPGWEEMASNDWAIRRDATKHFRSNEAYTLPENERVKAFMDLEKKRIEATSAHPEFIVPETHVSRLYAMHCFAVWIKKNFGDVRLSQETASKITDALAPELTESGLKKAIQKLCKEIGGLWGPATLLHGLMDAGFAAVKPDQHLLYTMVRLNCIANPDDDLRAVLDSAKAKQMLAAIDAKQTNRGKEAKKRDPDNPQMELAAELLRKEKYLFKAVHAARELASRIVPGPEARGKAAREVDIVLMRASYESTNGTRFVDTFQR